MHNIKDNIYLIIMLGFVIVLAFYDVFSGQFVFVSGDSLSPISLREGIKNSLNEFSTYPLWLPWIFSGMPSIHSFINISDLYYPQKIFLFFNKIGFPWIWNFLFHLIFSGYGMYSLLRYYSCNKYCSFFSSALFMISPYMVAMTAFGHGSQIMTASYIPLIILYLFKIYDQKEYGVIKSDKILDLCIFTLLLGLQLQRGHIQIAYYTWMMIGLYILIVNFSITKDRIIHHVSILKHNFYVLISLILGFLISSNIYFPVLNYLNTSSRSSNSLNGNIDYATQWSFSFKEIITFFVPSSLGFGGKLYIGDMPFTDYPNYIGIIILILAIIGYLKSKINKPVKLFFILVGIFSILISMGHNFIGFYKFFYFYFPFFNKFRVPVYILILFYFSILFFAAHGLEYICNLIKDKNKNFKFNYYFIIPLIILGLIYIFFSIQAIKPHSLNNLIQHDLKIIMFSIFLLFTTFFLVKKYRLNYKYLYIVFCIVCFYDYIRIAHEIISPKYHMPHTKILKPQKYIENYIENDEIVNYLNTDSEKFRIMDLLGPQNKWGSFNIENINGYHPAKLNSYNSLINTINKKGYSIWPLGILKMLNVKYLVMPFNDFSHPDFESIYSGSMYYFGPDQRYDGKKINSYIYKYEDFYPRLFYTKEIVNLSDEEILNEITSENFDPKNISYLNSGTDEIEYIYDSSSTVDLTYWSPNHIEFITETNSNQFLIISENFYKNGWLLTENNKNYKIYNVNAVLRGVLVPPGKHHFKMTFSPNDVILGKYISLSIFILILFVFIILIINKRKYGNL